MKKTNRPAIQPNNRRFAASVIDYLTIAAGALIYALSVVVFTAPNNIAPGGMTGIATMLNYVFGIPIGTVIFVLNIPLFIWGATENGMGFLAKTISGTAFLSVFIDVSTPFLPVYTGDTMLASIFGGILCGIGMGLVFYRGGSTGGTDIIAINLHKYFPFVSTGNIILITDVVILATVYFVYGSIESVLYAAIAIFVSIKVIDTFSYGTSRGNGKLMFIITKCSEEISKEIMTHIDRGVTLLEGEGAYSGEKKRIVMCAVRPQQVYKIQNTVKIIDPNAFIIVTTAGSIKGKGFAQKDETKL